MILYILSCGPLEIVHGFFVFVSHRGPSAERISAVSDDGYPAMIAVDAYPFFHVRHHVVDAQMHFIFGQVFFSFGATASGSRYLASATSSRAAKRYSASIAICLTL